MMPCVKLEAGDERKHRHGRPMVASAATNAEAFKALTKTNLLHL